MRRFTSWALIALGILLFAWFISWFAQGSTSARPAVTATVAGRIVPTLLPTSTPTPHVTRTPLEQLQALLITELDDQLSHVTWDADRSEIIVVFAVTDSFTEDMIKSGIRLDIVDILRTIYTSAIALPYQSIAVEATFPMRDVYGNTEIQTIIKAAYSRKTLDKVNWTGFLSDNIYTIAEQSNLYIHPAARP